MGKKLYEQAKQNVAFETREKIKEKIREEYKELKFESEKKQAEKKTFKKIIKPNFSKEGLVSSISSR